MPKFNYYQNIYYFHIIKPDDVNNILQIKLANYFERNNNLSKADLARAILKDHPNWSASTINVYLSRLKKAGKISNPARGTYTLASAKEFHPVIKPALKRLYNKVHRDFPYINCCVWDSAWLNSLMRHQPFRHYTVIEVEKDAISQVFASISESSKNVFLNPDAAIFDNYISNIGEAIIIKPLVSEAPVEVEKQITIPALEKLLVDMLIDKDLFAAQQGELRDIYKSAFDKYSVNTARMKRYALRRNREQEVSGMINITSAK